MLFSSYGMVLLLLMNYIKKYFQRETKMKKLLKKILIILLFTINISMNFHNNSSYSFNYYETMPLSEGSYMDLREF